MKTEWLTVLESMFRLRNGTLTAWTLHRLPTLRQEPVAQESIGEGMLYDFGRETFGYVRLSGLVGVAHLYYGESREEALDKDHCETLDIVSTHQELGSKAFRYV